MDDDECFITEFPQHEQQIVKDFWLGQTEVTNAAYRRFKIVEGPDLQPAVNVTWGEAQAFCNWAGGRLPAETEWEYAAKAGTTTARYGAIDEIAWYRGNSSKEIPFVAQKKPNAWALYDMLGGVWEWTADFHRPYSNRYDVFETREYSPGDRVLRGGHWLSSPEDARASFRLGHPPSGKLNTIGFRCLLEGQ
jgi:formylglycine-generating enzyme required for sulfatase activity